MVSTQAQTMRPTRPHFTASKRLVAPTPRMEVEMTCVVESGMPISEAPWIVMAAAVSAAKPWTGCSFTILWPIVRMIFQPPAAVPRAIVIAQRTITQ